MRRICFLAALFSILGLEAFKTSLEEKFDEPPKQGEVQAPWLTGPLIAQSGFTIAPGHYNIETYLSTTPEPARYNAHWKAISQNTFWENVSLTQLEVGISKQLDFQINPTFHYNYCNGAAKWGWGDMLVGLDIQLYSHTPRVTAWNTGLKFTLYETIPLGKYENLDPKKLGTDVGGGGSWQTGFALIWGNLFYLGRSHFLTARFEFLYTLPAPVHVKNLNTYGGGAGTRGTVYPAQNFFGDIGLELTLTRNWALALDIIGSWDTKTRFSGQTPLPNTAPPATQFSLAPAIEYNWSASLGMIAGPWFTVAGRNAVQFISCNFALNYYH